MTDEVKKNWQQIAEGDDEQENSEQEVHEEEIVLPEIVLERRARQRARTEPADELVLHVGHPVARARASGDHAHLRQSRGCRLDV